MSITNFLEVRGKNGQVTLCPIVKQLQDLRNIQSCSVFFDSSAKVKRYSNSISKCSHQQTTNTCNNMDESQKSYAKQK